MPPKASALLAFDSEHRLRAENLPFDIDVWYPALEAFTFPSQFLPLTRAEARAIIAYHDVSWRHAKDALTGDEIRVLQSLEERIESNIRTHFNDTGAFLRLCGRSPKDGEPLNRDAVREAYARELEKVVQESGQTMSESFRPDPAHKIVAIGRVNWLRVTSGREAMSLLLTSERAFADMIDWMHYGEPEQIVLRQFDADVILEYEFRAFVNRNQVNAISQYDHYGVYPSLQPMKQMLQEGILELWRTAHPHVGEDNYVMDFAYLPTQNRFVMVEISPFLPCTGSACFNWTADEHVMKNGPLEFRLNHNLHSHMEDILEANWDMRWETTPSPYWHLYDIAEAPPSVFSRLSSAFLEAVGISPSATPPPEPVTYLLFVYGTLKRGFHWHNKFLSTAEFVCDATTQRPLPLVIGESGVPYLLSEEHVLADTSPMWKCVRGEVWRVGEEAMEGLDQYEGVNKGYYSRVLIQVTHGEGAVMQANVYVKTDGNEELQAGPFFDEYTLDFHKEHYRAMRHIQVKQQSYVAKPSTWGKTSHAEFQSQHAT